MRGMQWVPSAHDVTYGDGLGDVWAWWAEHGFDGLAGALIAAGAVWWTLTYERGQSDKAADEQERRHKEVLAEQTRQHKEAMAGQKSLHEASVGAEADREVRRAVAEFLQEAVAVAVAIPHPAAPQDEWESWVGRLYSAVLLMGAQVRVRDVALSDEAFEISEFLGDPIKDEKGFVVRDLASAVATTSVVLAEAFLRDPKRERTSMMVRLREQLGVSAVPEDPASSDTSITDSMPSSEGLQEPSP